MNRTRSPRVARVARPSSISLLACVSGIFTLPSDTYHGDLSISPLHSLGRYLESIERGNMFSWFTGHSLLLRIRSIWKDVRSAFTTPQRPVDPAPSVAATSNQNMTPSMMVEETQHPTGSDSSEGEDSVLEAIPDSLGAVRPEVPSTSSEASSQSDPVDDEESNSSSDRDFNDGFDPHDYIEDYRHRWGITLPKVILSAVTETGQAETSIKVPKQRSYTGRKPIISSSLADTPCATLGIQVVLDRLNATLGTTHTLNTPSLSSLLEDCIEKNYDFGTAYARLRPVWNTHRDSNMQGELHRREKEDTEQRRNALVGNRIVQPRLEPRRVWDLYSNRVVPDWIPNPSPSRWTTFPISHAWVAKTDRVDVWTPINGKEWPVPIPKDADLKLIRIEMLNLGLQYTWLDVLCLRQKEEGGPREDLRVEEWKLDVPTIGSVYVQAFRVVIYLSGLGRPLSLKDGDLDSDQYWFRRAWTLQEVGDKMRIFAGDVPDGPMQTKPIDGDSNYETELLIRFHKQLESMSQWTRWWKPFAALAEMQKRVSTNEVDKVAGLAFTLRTFWIPTYHESETLEDAWTALVDAMDSQKRPQFLFAYPREGLGHKKWRPSWDQVMTPPLPVDIDQYIGTIDHGTETGEDSYYGPCIEKGLVRGLDTGLAEGHDRHGELIVEGAPGVTGEHAFKIRVTHQFPIPDDTYTLLGNYQLLSDRNSESGAKQPQYWAVGQRVSGNRFQKVSVLVMDDLEEVPRLMNLRRLAPYSSNVLV
ncbi:hypothetical protein EDD85DRAFT_563433 [Armillaria nabsnona]|nr:hypothetical protein EDD85DRAFT_563433 [Armillaria nabsnona]